MLSKILPKLIMILQIVLNKSIPTKELLQKIIFLSGMVQLHIFPVVISVLACRWNKKQLKTKDSCFQLPGGKEKTFNINRIRY